MPTCNSSPGRLETRGPEQTQWRLALPTSYRLGWDILPVLAILPLLGQNTTTKAKKAFDLGFKIPEG